MLMYDSIQVISCRLFSFRLSILAAAICLVLSQADNSTDLFVSNLLTDGNYNTNFSSSPTEVNTTQTSHLKPIIAGANLVRKEKSQDDNFSQPVATRRPRSRGQAQSSVQVYIIFIVGIIPAAIGATAWWIKILKHKCTRRKARNNSSQSSNDDAERVQHNLMLGDKIPIDHIASQIVRRADLNDVNNNKEMFIDNTYYRSNFIRSRRVYSMEIPRKHLELLDILGEGNFGQVWKAKAYQFSNRHKNIFVAVKTNKVNASIEEQEDLLKELDVMLQLGSHPNVVLLLGCCTENEPYYLVIEYMSQGKLLSFLRSHRQNSVGHYYELDWRKNETLLNNHNYLNYSCTNETNEYGTINSQHSKSTKSCLTPYDLINFAYQIAKGMEFISSHGIIHRDLAARNILIDEHNICKVADFGLSRSIRDRESDMYEMKHGGQMPIRWLSPEALSMGIFSTKSDVWAYGILLWEIATLGSTPYIGMSATEVINFIRQGNICPQPQHCSDTFYELMKFTWAYKAENRFTFTEIKHVLAKMLLDIKDKSDYIDLEHFDDSIYYFNTNNCKDEKL